jgi:hypothetical protein
VQVTEAPATPTPLAALDSAAVTSCAYAAAKTRVRGINPAGEAITHGAAIRNFQAPRLGKQFDVVVFGTLERG